MDTSCIKPDGEHCEHPPEKHIEPHPIRGGYWCPGCWDGKSLIGPECHKYNPHILTMAGWLPVGA
jgi:hypothetical protein